MNHKKIRIGIFASSHSLIDRVQAFAAEQPNQFFLNSHGLDDAIAPALEMVRNGVEVIISRRGTAHLLRENLRIPVLSFPHRSLDIFTSLTQAKAEGNKILLPVFRHEFGGFEVLEDLLRIKLVQQIYTDKASLKQAVAKGRAEGCHVVVGGRITQQSAEALGLKFVEIRSSEEDIVATPESVQIRLLRVLQEREIMRIGGDRKIPVDVRIIAAASQDLNTAVQEGRFRADLFFRLNVLRLHIPPLRERQEDIPLLLDFFIKLISDRHGLEPVSMPAAYLDRLTAYGWPGNVRQLRNFAERLVMNCNLRCNQDTLEMLFHELIQYEDRNLSQEPDTQPPVTLKSRMQHQAFDSERAIILEALEQCRYHKNRAAQRLGISRTTLWRKIKELGIE